MKANIARRAGQIIIGLLVFVLVILSLLLLQQILRLRRTGFPALRGNTPIATRNHRATLTEKDINTIQTWMTFGYINTAFNLPPEYLQNKLHITNPRYPFISLSGYAREQGVDSNKILAQVQKAMRLYFLNTNKQ